MSKHKYRLDIDGLRSIAIILVLFYHAGFNFFPGGYIGVDVFFVISGYLISTIIYREISEGTFTFRNFYRRRIQRLTPALFVMFYITTIASYIILLPNELLSYSKSLISAALSFSNVFFWIEHGGYFEGSSELIPLLHTWSLSIEEQYYLIWPIYLILFSKIISKKHLLPATILIFLLSLFFSEYVVNVTFGAGYYLLPTRIFELAAGSILAIRWKNLPSPPRLTNDILSLIGLSLILYSSTHLNKESLFPGYNALPVVLGTSLLIYSGKKNLGVINRLFSYKPFVFIGLISYSLYLWHWPIIVFIKYIGIEITPQVSTIIVIVSIITGWLSYRFVEQPFRTKNELPFKSILTRLFIAPLIAVILASGAIYINNGAPSRFNEKVALMDIALSSKPNIERGECHSVSRNSTKEPSNQCIIGDVNSSVKAFYIGDSHANHFTGFIDEIAKKSGVAIQDYTLDACLPVFDLYWGRNSHYSKICKQRNDISMNHIKNTQYSYVILAGSWPTESSFGNVYLNNTQLKTENELNVLFSKKFEETIRTIINAGATPIIIKDNPSSSKEGPRCTIIREVFKTNLTCETPRVKAEENASFINDVIGRTKKKFPQLKVIDPLLSICDDTSCYSDIDGIPLYRDTTHLNEIGSRALGKNYYNKYGGFINPTNK